MSRETVIVRRGLAMAELFIAELQPKFITDFEVGKGIPDYVAGFVSSRGRTIVFSITVRVTTEAVADTFRFRITNTEFERFTTSNSDYLFLLTDVTHTKTYFGWIRDAEELRGQVVTRTQNLTVPVTEATPDSIQELRTQIVTQS
jgi:hypothetical protein